MDEKASKSADRGSLRRLHEDENGATMLEWALLVAGIGIPSYFLIRLAMFTLFGHYQLITSVNALPFP